MASDIGVAEVEAAAMKLVYAARRDGTLGDLTIRRIRAALALQLGLPEDTLKSEFKSALKSAVSFATDGDLPATEVEVAIQTKKRKAEEVLESPPKRKPSAKPRKTSNSKQFKSAEMIPTSDMEEDLEAQPEDNSAEGKPGPSRDSAKENDGTSPGPKAKKITVSSVSRPSPRPSSTSKVVADSDSDLDDGPPKKTKKSQPKKVVADSDSELEDEPPKKPKKTKPKAAKSKEKADKPKASKGKKASELSKDEETIKRLKSLVLACGVRKVWAKLFQDVDTPSQQIRMLKEILTDLGMTGRMSLEQAKSIKARRELAQELEDVQTFAAAATRSKAKPAQEEKSEEEEEELPVRRKTNAYNSIQNFLRDQSDED
ncbi:hypothetical protein C8R46DRAFT_1079247 [Mycena filopes]|nr:hypothetical protein C8R46DRAFT_1079247 [Mycena filopes]